MITQWILKVLIINNFNDHRNINTPLVVCLWVEWFLWARFLLECMSILFHLTGLTLFSASACFISIYFHKILMLWNTIICSSDCFAKSSILLCSHGAYCLNRVCTQKTLNLSRLGSSIIIFVTPILGGLFEAPFWVCVLGGGGGGGREEGGGRTTPLP